MLPAGMVRYKVMRVVRSAQFRQNELVTVPTKVSTAANQFWDFLVGLFRFFSLSRGLASQLDEFFNQ